MLSRLFRQIFRLTPAAARPVATDWLAEALRLRALGNHAGVETLCQTILAREPANIDAHNFLAAALLAQGNSQAGIAHLRRAAELAPPAADIRANLADVLAAVGDHTGAIENYRRALDLRADLPDTWVSLASLLKALGRYDEAEQSCRSGLRANADHGPLQHLLATVLFEQGRLEEAIAAVRVALVRDPALAAAGSTLLRMLNYADQQDPAAVYREHRAWADRHAEPLTRAAATHANSADPARKLRIGYVSPYLHKHAVTFFLEPVIEHHDRANFEITLYADVAQPDEYSRRLQAHGAKWRGTLDLNDEEFAGAVRRDAIDILVDLSGHTTNNRLLAFARRPAPVQVNWLGFPSTTGMTAMNYRITDAWCDPPGMTEHLNSEKLARLPRVYMAWRPPDGVPAVGPLPASDAGHVTFGSFNSCFKITSGTVALWSRILERVPRSRLVLLAISSQAAQRHFRGLFERHGTDPERIDFRPRLAFDEYLASFQHADIALDAFPYHGATTTCFTLWMGLPVVVLAGATHASRADISMLSNVGLPELVAHTSDDYVEIAARLASDLPALANMRAALRGMMLGSPVTDGRGCAQNIDRAFREMWTTWCRTGSRE